MVDYFFMKGKKMSKNPITTITMENEKSITIELYPEIAPNTVNNFISLIKKKFYDGKVIEGMDEVDRIANAKKDRNDKPLVPEKILKVMVDCFGEDYPEPEIEMS